jgi:nucleoside-diphosphate-sugar epimerase
VRLRDDAPRVRTLVTGGHGFIGSHLVDVLLARGHEVRALASPWGKLDNLEKARSHDRCEVVHADIREPGQLAPAMEGIEVVFHSAARVADWGPWPLFDATNVVGTKNVIDAAVTAGCRRLVHVSSVAVHRYSGFRDADPRQTRRAVELGNYGRSKRIAEELVEAARRRGLETVIARPGLWPFGPRDPQFHKLAGALRKGGPILVRGGESVINTAYAENLAEGLCLCGEIENAKDRIYLIADEGAPSWKELLLHLCKLLGVPLPRASVPGFVSRFVGSSTELFYALAFPRTEPPLTQYRGQVMVADVHFSSAAAHEELGFSPTIDWREGLRRTVESGAAASA